MAIDALKNHVVKGLREAREQLLDIGPGLIHSQLTQWHSHNSQTLLQANRIGGIHSNHYILALQGHDQSPIEVLDDVRSRLVGYLDESIKLIDTTQVVETVFETNIKKVKDPKLAALLLEFNDIKERAPNAASVIFRTIIMLVIQERAKLRVPPLMPLATRQDLNLKPVIEEALANNLFDRADEKFLKLFLPSGKAIFDNVAHSPGASADKQHLSTMVEPLNKLIAAIV